MFHLNHPFKDASVFVVSRDEWDGHCYYQSVLKVDSCILSSCSTRGGKETRGFCRGYSGRCVTLCICSSVLFSECALKGISTLRFFTVTGHMWGGGVV